MKLFVALLLFASPLLALADDVPLMEGSDATVRKTIPLMSNGEGNRGGDIGSFTSSAQGLACDPRYCLAEEPKPETKQ